MQRFFVKKTYIVDVEDKTVIDDLVKSEKPPKKARNAKVTVVPAPIKPDLEQIISHYKTGMQGEDPICLTCDIIIVGPFTDLNGQIRCAQCGTTYQWMGSHLKDEFLVKNNLTREQIAQRYCDMFEYIPLTRMYWQEVGKRMPFGVYITNSPFTQDELDSFYGWLVKGSERFELVYDGFNWQGLKREYAPA